MKLRRNTMTRKLTGLIPLSDGGSTCSYLGRVDEFADKAHFINAAIRECGQLLDWNNVRQLYVRVCICSDGQIEDWPWHIEEYGKLQASLDTRERME